MVPSKLGSLTGKLAPDHKTIANFRKGLGAANQAAYAHFVVCAGRRSLGSIPDKIRERSRSRLGPTDTVQRPLDH